MKHNFTEHNDLNLVLNSVVNEISLFSQNQLNKIKELNQIGMALSAERNLDKLLDMILFQARKFTGADAGTLYLKDSTFKKLNFQVIQNDSIDTLNLNKIHWTPLNLYKGNGSENREMVAVLSFLTGEVIHIDDVYDVDGFNFEGTKKFDKVTGYKSKSMFVVPMKNSFNDTIGVVQLLNKKDKNSKIIPFNQEDKDLTLSLASQAAISITRVKQEELLIQQSKIAAVCEMIDAIAHQWKQPLNAISMYISNIPLQYELGELNKDFIDRNTLRMNGQIEHLVNTLDEFKKFFRPNKRKQEFDIKEIIKTVMLLVKDEFVSNDISFIINTNSVKASGFANEYKHIILNIINNSKDAFNEKNIKNREIMIELKSNKDKAILEISDNAGGINEDILSNIFDANFTTKSDNSGTGIGLYMSKTIIHNMNGEIFVKNIYDSSNDCKVRKGVKFIIEVPKGNK